MSPLASGALVFYGATGDLAFKKIFPALQRMVKAGVLDVPVIGVARQGWSLERLQARARESVEQHGGGVDPEAFPRLMKLLRYVEGEYASPSTFDALRRELGGAERPLHYMAIPQDLFEVVVMHLNRTGCDTGARLVLEKPFGSDLASARRLNAILHHCIPERDIFRIDHYLGKEAVHVRFRLSPEFVIALGATVREPGEKNGGHDLELVASHDHEGAETDPYAELLGDAMKGETFRFARQDYVEEAWRIVDPLLAGSAAPVEYDSGTWGPREAEALVPGGWFEPRESR